MHRQPIWWHLLDVTLVSQVEQVFHVVRIGRKVAGAPVRSLNLKEHQLQQSMFFTDRPIETLTPEAVRWGPTRPEDLAQPPYTVTKPKLEGKTAGFFVRDARGHQYLFKLDPPEAPELLTGAEVVTSKLLSALGYHVPSYEIVRAHRRDFRPDPAAAGRARALSAEALQTLLTQHERGGEIRLAASKLLDGEILGPMRFKQFRDCTEIRGLRLAYAWVNNTDSKDHNTLMVWDGTRAVGYLIDFGTSFGADAGTGGPKNPCAGWTYAVDLPLAVRELTSLGRYRSGCDLTETPVNAQVGRFSPRFNPAGWRPYAPNLAFAEMNDDDADWLARRLARLSRAQIDAAVSAGQYASQKDRTYLLETLEARRAAILARYLEEEEEP